MKKTNQPSSKQKAFTLIEVLVAITVLMFAIVGPLTLAFRSINYTKVARDQVVANYLAQDALEFMIAKKVYNARAGADWLEGMGGITGCDESTESCQLETNTTLGDSSSDLSACNKDTVDGCRLYYDEAEAVYTYDSSGNVATDFKRWVTVEKIANNIDEDEARISVTIKWNTGIIPKLFKMETYIYNHRI